MASIVYLYNILADGDKASILSTKKQKFHCIINNKFSVMGFHEFLAYIVMLKEEQQ